MNCPLEARENAELLLDYCHRKLNPEAAADLEDHIAICPACGEFARNQQTVWKALDQWEAAPASADFNRRLYARIDRDVSLWDKLTRPFRPATLRWNPLAAVAACAVVLMAGVMVERYPSTPAPPAKDMAQVEPVQPEQVERALDAMDLLTEFSHHVKDSPNAKM